MNKNVNPKDLFDSMKKGLGKFYREAKDSANSQENLLQKEIDDIKALRVEGRRYVQPRIHAQGGMKMIISSSDRLIRRQVAIAKMKENKLDRDSLKLFLHEARILARLDHPNIVPLYDIGLDPGGEPYFTMKLLSGETLEDILLRLSKDSDEYLQKYSLSHLLEIFLKVSEAVAFAHSRNVVHRDLKPANIQVSDYGEVLLCDWGLAKDINLPDQSTQEIHLTEVLSQQTICGVIKGTPGYMAPEQLDLENGDITEKTDIYSLGCILYALLTHTKPIESDSLEMLKKKTMEGQVIPASQRSSKNIPKALEAVVSKAMSVKPQERYPDAKSLIKEVRAFLDGYATKAQNADFKTQIMLLFKRHRAISLSVAISFIIIGLLVAFFLVKLKDREHSALKAMHEAEKQKLEAEKQKEDKVRLSRMVAPEFLAKASSDLRSFNFENALKYSKLCTSLDESLIDAWILYGRMELGKLNFFNAAAAFSKAKDQKRFKSLYDICIELEKNEVNPNIPELIIQLKKMGENYIVPALIGTFNKNNSAESKILTIRKIYDHYHNHVKSPKPLLSPDCTRLSFTNGNKWVIQDLNLFCNFPIESLIISKSPITDLRALKSMNLKKLDISKTQITSIYSLKALQLEELNIADTKITDIRSIQNQPIKILNIYNAKIKYYNVLLELETLEKLVISKNQAAKIEFLDSLKQKNVAIEILP